MTVDLAGGAGRRDVVAPCLWELGEILYLQPERRADAADALFQALDPVRADGLGYLEPDLVMSLAHVLLGLGRPAQGLSLIDGGAATAGDAVSGAPETGVMLAAIEAAAAFRVGDPVRAGAACLRFAEQRRRTPYSTSYRVTYDARTFQTEDAAQDVARALGLDLDLPDRS